VRPEWTDSRRNLLKLNGLHNYRNTGTTLAYRLDVCYQHGQHMDLEVGAGMNVFMAALSQTAVKLR
jgi:hypothetical protein